MHLFHEFLLTQGRQNGRLSELGARIVGSTQPSFDWLLRVVCCADQHLNMCCVKVVLNVSRHKLLVNVYSSDSTGCYRTLWFPSEAFH
jgi:hypothetical protein